MNSEVLHTSNRNLKITIFCIVILYCLMPVAGILFMVCFVLEHKKREPLHVLFFLLAIYLGLINSTKVPESDQIMYHEAFKLVPYRTLWDNLTGIYGMHGDSTTKEMGYGILNIIAYYFSFGSYPLFIIYFTTVVYLLLFYSIEKWFDYLKVYKPIIYTISGVLTIAFFTQYFNITVHLQRQVIATAFIVYSITKSVTENRLAWRPILVAVTLHTSVGLFLPMFLLFMCRNHLSQKKIFFIYGLMIFSFSVLGNIASSLLNFLGEDVYALQRLEGFAESGREDRMSSSLTIIINLPMMLISILNLVRRHGKPYINETLFFLFYLFVMLFSTLAPNNTMQYRYFMMSYAFIPFILPLVSRSRTFIGQFFLFMIPTFLFFRFYLTFENITFKYAPVEDVLLSNVFTLFNYNNL